MGLAVAFSYMRQCTLSSFAPCYCCSTPCVPPTFGWFQPLP